jgi:transposase
MTTFSILEIMIYKNYECSRNRLTKLFYAYPVNDLTTCRKVTASTPDALKRAIDMTTENQPLAPWELPYSTAQIAA